MVWAIQNRSFVEGRIRLSGGDPDKMLLSHVLDAAYALLVELFQSHGMSLSEALEAVADIGHEEERRENKALTPVPAATVPRPQEEAANLALLGSVMSGSDFKGSFV